MSPGDCRNGTEGYGVRHRAHRRTVPVESVFLFAPDLLRIYTGDIRSNMADIIYIKVDTRIDDDDESPVLSGADDF